MRSEGRGSKKKTAPARGRAEAVGVHYAEGARNGTLGLYGAQRTDRVDFDLVTHVIEVDLAEFRVR